MTLKQLEAFYWAAMLGTFAIAAERLHVTQSSLSKRIAELEADLDVVLFNRSGQRAKLTDAGEALLPKVSDILELEEQIRQRNGIPQDVQGACRVGISELSATTWFPHLVRRLRDEHPLIELKPTVGLGKELERKVERGELDCAVVTGGPSVANLQAWPVDEVAFAWMAAPSRLRKGTLIDAELLRDHPVISPTSDSGLSNAVQAWASTLGPVEFDTVPCNSLNAILGMTVAGVGVSFLPAKYVEPLVRRKMLVSLRSEPPAPSLSYQFVARRDDSRRLVAVIRDLVIEEADFTAGNPLWVA
ncbi:LysR family transcriptional regulator [Hydrogenophaga sp.]|uniref:LysR family transcriptional regulator n=1 Tax=Hydrogenophaga sp. TaxID=1904254 RepID=UPI00391BAA38